VTHPGRVDEFSNEGLRFRVRDGAIAPWALRRVHPLPGIDGRSQGIGYLRSDPRSWLT
jgi:hypothetical protein